MQTSLIPIISGVDINFSGVKPFLKWAGGKGQLIEKLVELFPPEMKTGKIVKYAEPFIGGGALFFYVAQTYPSINYFFLSDVNQELILSYKTIQKKVENKLQIDFLNFLRMPLNEKENVQDYLGYAVLEETDEEKQKTEKEGASASCGFLEN